MCNQHAPLIVNENSAISSCILTGFCTTINGSDWHGLHAWAMNEFFFYKNQLRKIFFKPHYNIMVVTSGFKKNTTMWMDYVN